jgi:hypothetical protein
MAAHHFPLFRGISHGISYGIAWDLPGSYWILRFLTGSTGISRYPRAPARVCIYTRVSTRERACQPRPSKTLGSPEAPTRLARHVGDAGIAALIGQIDGESHGAKEEQAEVEVTRISEVINRLEPSNVLGDFAPCLVKPNRSQDEE